MKIDLKIVLIFGLIPIFWDISGQMIRGWGLENQIWQSLLFIVISSLLSFVIGLPWKMYDTFVIEQKHGFNKETIPFFIKDRIKKQIVSMALMLPITAAIIWIIEKGGPYFFLYVWIFLSVVIFFLMTIYPEFIAPLFDKYTPLPEGELRTKIEALASRLKFPLKKLYVVEGMNSL